MSDQEIFDLYMEIIKEMESAGCSFSGDTYHDLLDSLYADCFYIHRTDGEITTFCNYRMEGESVFVIDCFNKSRNGLRQMIKTLRSRIKGKGLAFYHKVRTESQFRYFPSQKGAMV